MNGSPISYSDKKYKVLGTRPIRHDGTDKVTGRAIYTNDVHFPDMVHGKILRSPHAHAKIKSIDTSAAQALDGVVAVITGKDWPHLKDKVANLGEGSVHLSDLSENCMAIDKALYKGHAIAAVAARNVHIAEEALALIRVEYEVLPSVLWVQDAMQDDAPILHEELRTDHMGTRGDKPTNIAKHLHFEQGDVDAAMASADVVIEREFKTATVHQGYIEPHNSISHWNEDGKLKVWTSTQGSFTCRQQVAELLQIPLSRVTVTPCEIGGGFGGKIAVYLEPVAALLSRKCGRPVKMVMQRDEVLEATGPTPGSYIRVKIGATKEGRLVAGDAYLAYDAGAYRDGVIGPGCMCMFSCVDLPNARVHGYDVCLNKPKTQAYRAPGATQAAFAFESVMSELADQLGICPLELRLKNAAKEGTRRVDGPVYPRVGLVECLEAAKQSDHWNTPLEGKNRGRGIAAGFWFNIGLKSSVSATVNSDGTINLLEGSTDIGGTRTSIAMQLAETLGIAAEDVHPKVVDTDSVGYTDVTGGSRTTFATGLAAYEVGLDLRKQLCERAAVLWECDAEEVRFDSGTFLSGDKTITFRELAEKLPEIGQPVVGRASISKDVSTNGFGVHICDVEVDPETGKVRVLRYTAIQDAGKAIHPSYVEGQLQGGAVQGIGWALNEEYYYRDDATMANASLLDYRMPTCYDLPMIDTIIVEVPNPDHPYGVRGVGETPIVPPPAAVQSAIYHACGARMFELPMSPPKLWKAISQLS
ncbi:xanthine dehydrogenase family protein molybdopterin-binding subunit [Bremerella sp. P1]|uniref:xanthine dehydrogenase family protein molybdopterin-binding subunit n=1 Tax=Bremerella sp. P1 TaxID=3026424 RepID=UPI0023688553|nr:xanthine dehydrogenase family protein molybdopterin-binding subunit [Bremerella sp. P1]WDI40723.1 xanthine dehydrogenase family protein molybdopterin-binding subunit [Bremerella sp. P1]